MLRSYNLNAFLIVDLCRVSISPPFSEHLNYSDNSLEKPVQMISKVMGTPRRRTTCLDPNFQHKATLLRQMYLM
jgi:hypothetical protein